MTSTTTSWQGTSTMLPLEMVKHDINELDWYDVCEWSLRGPEFTHLSPTDADKLICFWTFNILSTQQSI